MWSRGAHRRGRAAGFTVLEMLVSFTVLAVAMLIASQLLLESQMRMAHSARRAFDPVASLALKQIRADVRAAARVSPGGFDWTWEPLVLNGHPAGTVRYEKVGSDLLRKIVDAGGTEQGSGRIVMRRVNVWRWHISRSAPLPLVEIELGYREIPRLGRLAAGGQREAPLPLTRKHRVAVSPRQVGGKRGW